MNDKAPLPLRGARSGAAALLDKKKVKGGGGAAASDEYILGAPANLHLASSGGLLGHLGKALAAGAKAGPNASDKAAVRGSG